MATDKPDLLPNIELIDPSDAEFTEKQNRPNRMDLIHLGINQAAGHLLGAVSRKVGICLSQPTRITLNIREGCNLKCKHCDFYLGSQPADALSIEEWEHCIDQLVEWLGPINLTVTASGEALLVGRHCIRLVARAASQGVRVQLSTNGTPLTPRLIDGLVNAGLASLTVSLDGITPQTHDFVRGISGTHERVMRNIRLTNERRGRMVLSIQAVIVDQNLEELEPLAWWVKEEGLSKLNLQALQPVYGRPPESDWYQKSPLFPRDPMKVAQTLARLRELRDQGLPIDVSDYEFETWTRYYYQPSFAPIPHCAVGYKNLNISETGVATVCGEIRPLGNVRLNSPKELWRSQAATEARAEVAGCQKSCSILNCNIERPLLTKADRFFKEFTMSGR